MYESYGAGLHNRFSVIQYNGTICADPTVFSHVRGTTLEKLVHIQKQYNKKKMNHDVPFLPPRHKSKKVVLVAIMLWSNVEIAN